MTRKPLGTGATEDQDHCNGVDARPASMLEIIAQAVADPRMDVEKMERLFALAERQEATRRQTAFMAALSALQAELPMIHKGGINNFTKTKYARREDIHLALQPLLAKHGFAFSLNEESREGNLTRFSGTLYHKEGHSEVKYKTLQTDEAAKNSAGKATRTAIQDDGSTTSYAGRYLIKMHLSIVETEEDTDGNPRTRITPQQAQDLETALVATTMDKKKFFVFMRVGDYEEILADDFKKAMNAISVKADEDKAGKK